MINFDSVKRAGDAPDCSVKRPGCQIVANAVCTRCRMFICGNDGCRSKEPVMFGLESQHPKGTFRARIIRAVRGLFQLNANVQSAQAMICKKCSAGKDARS